VSEFLWLCYLSKVDYNLEILLQKVLSQKQFSFHLQSQRRTSLFHFHSHFILIRFRFHLEMSNYIFSYWIEEDLKCVTFFSLRKNIHSAEHFQLNGFQTKLEALKTQDFTKTSFIKIRKRGKF